MAVTVSTSGNQIGVLLRGEPESLRDWLERSEARRVGFCLGVILAGAGSYGAATGWWRDPVQGLFVAIKFPLIILLTTIGNALLNAMLAPLLGLNITLRQSFTAMLMSFAIASAILGSFSPLAAFLVLNAPPLTSSSNVSEATYNTIQLAHVAVVAFAGIVANVHLLKLLRALSGNGGVAGRVLLGWLAGNLFLGSQVCWILRPFIGAPGLEVEFLRKTAFHGNFYEIVFRGIAELFK